MNSPPMQSLYRNGRRARCVPAIPGIPDHRDEITEG